MYAERILTALLALVASTAHAAYTLAPLDSRGTGGDAQAIAMGDVNGDGRSDMVVTNGSSTVQQLQYQILVHLQQADGSFAVAIGFPFTPSDRTDVAIGNLDGDRAQEIVVGHGGGITIVDWDSGRGRQQVTSQIYGNAWSRPADNIALIDLDRDGVLDVVSKGVGADVLLHFGDGEGAVRNIVPITLGVQMYNDLDAGDFNGDGYMDFAVLSSVSRAYVFLNNGTQGTAPFFVVNPNPIGSGFYPSLAGGDFTGDGRDDLVIVSNFRTLSLFEQSASNNLVLADTLEFSEGPLSEIGHDFDLDGGDDLLVQTSSSPLRLFLHTSDGLVEQPPFDFANGPTRNGLAAGDIDGDDCTDLAVASNAGLAVYKGAGCNPVADLAVHLGLSPTTVAVRLDNTGAGAAAAPETTVDISVLVGTLAVGALPSGCTIDAQDSRSAKVTCVGADLAPASNRMLLLPVTVGSTERRNLLTASAITTTTTLDLHLDNNAAQTSTRVTPMSKQLPAAGRK